MTNLDAACKRHNPKLKSETQKKVISAATQVVLLLSENIFFSRII